MKEYLDKILECIEVKQKMINDDQLLKRVDDVVNLIIETFKMNKKIILCGNGGSAADAQHITAEFVGRYLMNRESLPAISLTTNTSNITAIANDFSFDDIFMRQLAGLGNEGDLVWGFSTSGNSQNVVNALEYAKNNNMNTVSFTGKDGGKVNQFTDVLIAVPSASTPRIQESHIMLGHLICEFVENKMNYNNINL